MTDRSHVFTSWGLDLWAKELAEEGHPFAAILDQYATAWEEDVADASNHYYEQGARDAEESR